jgi:D-arabinose 1-dehydrogenase-like Zn-dependent alcohol dehydrogenase
MRVVQVREPNAPLELVERAMPEPAPREVRLKVEACGICHSDAFTVTGTFPGVRYPTVPGHEVAGRIDKLGSAVTTWRLGQRVGVGWFGGVCFVCDRCRRGDFITCRNLKVPGIHYDGGYADYMIAPMSSHRRPQRPCSALASPPSMLCAIRGRAPAI